MATVGGNFFAPPPGGDFATALLALDAKLVLVGKQGERKIPVKDFFTGFMTNVLRAEEIIKEIQVELPHGKAVFNKFGRRHANTPSIVSLAVYFEFDSETISKSRIALNAVGPYPFRAEKTEEFLVGKTLNPETIKEAGVIAASESTPFTDPIATEWYRMKMIPVMLTRTLEKIRD
jgi:xanthine dehydrogenase small subunit